MWAWLKRIWGLGQQPHRALPEPPDGPDPITHLEILREALVEEMIEHQRAAFALNYRIADIDVALAEYEE